MLDLTCTGLTEARARRVWFRLPMRTMFTLRELMPTLRTAKRELRSSMWSSRKSRGWIRSFNADGKLNDAHQVKVAMTNASLFGYVADGKNGLRILQLTSPETMPEYAGFSPRPQPVLIATFKTKGEALAISKAARSRSGG